MTTMWFKNAIAYRLPVGWPMTAPKLAEALARKPYEHPSAQDLERRGFVAPRAAELVEEQNGAWLIALQTGTKLLPAAIVNQEAADRAADIEEMLGYRPGRKQMKEIKEAVTQDLLPLAFVKRSTIYAWIDPRDGWLVVDAGSPAKADAVIESLRDVLDDLPLRLFDTERSPVSCMKDWLESGNAPDGFTIDRDCELRAAEKAAVRYANHALDGDEIPAHLAAGKFPTRLALTFNDRIGFVLTEHAEIKRLAFLDAVQAQAEKTAAAGDEQFDADLFLMSAELRELLARVSEALGGLRREEAGDLIDRAESEPGSDPLFEQAVTILRKYGHASISLVQRHLLIGYNRAARLIEAMEHAGVVSPIRRDGTREVRA